MGQRKQVIEDLQQALDGMHVGERQKTIGAQLINHLSDAVTIVVLGLPGSGKSSVINLILGEEAIREEFTADIVELKYGQPASRAGKNLKSALSEATQIEVSWPSDALKTYNFCEVKLPSDGHQLPTLFEYAIQNGQIFIWCSESFGPEEQAIWANAPDEVKDHSLLALTKADRQIMKGELAQRISELEDISTTEFVGLYPIAALHALKSQSAGVDQPDLWEASGGKDLQEAVQAQVASGEAAELDRAAFLLAQLASESSVAAQEPPLEVISSEQNTGTNFTPEAELLEQLQHRLSALAKELMAEVDQGKLPNSKAVFQQCSHALRDIVGALESKTTHNNDVAEILNDARDGEDMLMLLQVEEGATAAEDAIFLMIQLKKEIGSRVRA